ALLKVHVDKFKSHRLRPRTTHNGLRPEGAHSMRQLQVEKRPRSQVAFAGADSTAKIKLRNRQSEIFPKIGRRPNEISRKLQPGVASLPDHRGVRLGIGRLKGKVLAINAG